MSRYVEPKHITHAVRFDGSDASAFAAVKEVGGDLRLSNVDGALALHIGAFRIEPGAWILARDGIVWWLDDQNFADLFVPVCNEPIPPPPAPAPAAAAPQSSTGFAEGDEVVAIHEPEAGTMTVMEIENGVLVCDGPWGEKRIHASKARRLDAAA